jgi:hypothetical protein
MRFRNFFHKLQRTPIVEEFSNTAEAQKVDAPERPMSEGEMYSDLLTMNLFANYYPQVFPDQSMFR